MRIMAIIVVLTVVAFATNQKWLGALIFMFIAGCALFGVAEAVVDVVTGNSTLTAEGRRKRLIRNLELNPGLNPCYYNLRRRGKSHEECLRRGEPPVRPDDYFERKIERMTGGGK